MIKPGVKFMDLFCLKNMHETILFTAWNRQSRRERSFRKDCKNAVELTDIYQFKGHAGSTFHGIFIATGGSETAFATERDKLKLSAVGTAIHGTAKGRTAAVKYFIDIFHLSFSGMKGMFNFFIMVGKDFL